MMPAIYRVALTERKCFVLSLGTNDSTFTGEVVISATAFAPRKHRCTFTMSPVLTVVDEVHFFFCNTPSLFFRKGFCVFIVSIG